MKNNLIQDLKILANAEDSKTFIEDLRVQNKQKEWCLNPIKINLDNGMIVHNAEEIKKAVEVLQKTLLETLSATNDLLVVESLNENLKVVSEWLKGTRLQVTKPFDELKSSFTDNEKILKGLVEDIKIKKDKLLEEVYRKARIKIFIEIQILADELYKIHKITLHFKIFEDFVNVKKKLKSMIPNEKGKIGAGALKQIKENFDLIANPLIDAKQLAEVKEKEHNILTQQISKIIIIGTDEILNNSIIELNQMMEQTSMYFQNIEESAKSQIKSTISIVTANIRTNAKAIEYNKQKILDDEMIEIRSTFENSYGMMNLTIVQVQEYINKFTSFDFSIFSDENRNNARDIATHQIKNLNQIKYAIEQKAKEDEAPTEDNVPRETFENLEVTHMQTGEFKTFKLSEGDTYFLSKLTVDALSEEEAKEQLTNIVSNHIQMTMLSEVK